MFGLSLGAYIAGKYIHKITKPLLVYGLLEGGIAVAAVLVPFLLKLFYLINFVSGKAARQPNQKARWYGSLSNLS